MRVIGALLAAFPETVMVSDDLTKELISNDIIRAEPVFATEPPFDNVLSVEYHVTPYGQECIDYHRATSRA